MTTTQNELLYKALEMLLRYKEQLLIHSDKRPTRKETEELIERIKNALISK